MMKVAIPVVLMACAASGCAVVPYSPGVYVQPAPVVVGPSVYIAPRPYHYGRPDGYRYGRGGPHWRDREDNDYRR